MSPKTYRRAFTATAFLFMPVPVFVFGNSKVEGLLIAPISHWLLDLIKIGVKILEHWSETDGFAVALFTMLLGILGVQALFFSVLLFGIYWILAKWTLRIKHDKVRAGVIIFLLGLPLGLSFAPLYRPIDIMGDSPDSAGESRARVNQWQLHFERFRRAKGSRGYRREMPGLASLDELARQGKYGEAESSARRMVEIERENEQVQFGAQRYGTMDRLQSLAWILNVQGKYAEAERSMRDAHAIVESRYREEVSAAEKKEGRSFTPLGSGGKLPLVSDAQLLNSIKELSVLLSAQDKHAEAERLLRLNLQNARRQAEEVGPYRAGGAVASIHLGVESALYPLADELRVQGRFGEAEALCREAMEVRGRLVGEMKKAGGSPSGNQTYGQLANHLVLARIFRDQGNYSASDPLFIRIVAATHAPWRFDIPKLPSLSELATLDIPHHNRTPCLGALIGLAESLRRQGEFEKALPLGEKVLQSKLHLPAGCPRMIEFLETLAGIHAGLENDTEAEAFLLWAGSKRHEMGHPASQPPVGTNPLPPDP